MTIDGAKAFAAITGGVCAIAAAGAAWCGYTPAAFVAGGILIVAGIGLATGLGGEGS